jgi:hypothetical protein
MRPRGTPSAGLNDSGSPEGAMTCLQPVPPLTVSGADRPAATEQLQSHTHRTMSSRFACGRRSHAVLINFVLESVHRFPRGSNANDFH